MRKELLDKFKEAIVAILPIVIVLFVISFSIPSFSSESNQQKFGPVILSLIISSVPLILGTVLFSLGVEKSIAKIGSIVGSKVTKRKSIILLLIIGGMLGFLATLAEPDLSLLSSRISKSGPDWILILIASLGVGLFMIVSILRVIFNKKLKHILTIGYGLIFTLGCLADKNFFSIAFDAGGVTTGVVTVPFILALSTSVARVLGGKDSEDNSFGYSGLCSMGTVLAVMIYSLILKNTGLLSSLETTLQEKFNLINGSDELVKEISTYSDLGKLYLENFLSSLKDVILSLSPLLLFFIIFSFFIRIKKKTAVSIYVGFLYTFLGLVLFFLGAESGFIPFASRLGQFFGDNNDMFYLFIIVGFILGFISMIAEPSVKILARNVSDVSAGAISEKTIFLSLCLSSGIALVVNCIRINFDIDILLFIIPLFIVTIALSFLTPEIYVGIAIDAAGVATGTMASCLFLPMSIGFTAKRYDSVGMYFIRDGFGVVGIMSIFPIIICEILGILAVSKTSLRYKKAIKRVIEEDDSQIIHLPM